MQAAAWCRDPQIAGDDAIPGPAQLVIANAAGTAFRRRWSGVPLVADRAAQPERMGPVCRLSRSSTRPIGRFVDDDRAMSLAVFTKNFPKGELDGLQTFSLALDALASDSIISTSTKTFAPALWNPGPGDAPPQPCNGAFAFGHAAPGHGEAFVPRPGAVTAG